MFMIGLSTNIIFWSSKWDASLGEGIIFGIPMIQGGNSVLKFFIKIFYHGTFIIICSLLFFYFSNSGISLTLIVNFHIFCFKSLKNAQKTI